MTRLRSKLTFANVCSFLALLIALGTGSAYAANTVFSSDIVDGQVKTADIGNNQVKAPDIAAGAVDGAAILDGSVGNFEITPGAVTHSKLGASSIDGSNVASNSITSADILGADVSGHVSFSIGGNSCNTLTFGVSGAQVGQVPLFTFTGSGPFSNKLQITPFSVTSANTITGTGCNHGRTTISVSNAPVRVMTFG
jgi:hypothetical protein